MRRKARSVMWKILSGSESLCNYCRQGTQDEGQLSTWIARLIGVAEGGTKDRYD